MDSGAVAMLLPKGFVLNDAGIYDEVASYSVVPPEKITKFWGVYTTTFRRLVDPTASRLEYFWWHVWGSDRRYLSGPALAKIFKEISDGPTFVPLRGPPNRYDPQQELMVKGDPLPRDSSQRAESDQGRDRGSLDSVTPKEPTPSSSRPPPAHPILKKPRGPSTSGSRPTARFALPPDSDDGEDGKAESSQSTASDMPPPPRPVVEKGEKRAATAMTKKFVASTAASKRRPALPRRQSSHSSETSYPPPAPGANHVASQRSDSQSSTGSSSLVEGSSSGSHSRRTARKGPHQQTKRSPQKTIKEPPAPITDRLPAPAAAEVPTNKLESIRHAEIICEQTQTRQQLGMEPHTTLVTRHPWPAAEQPASNKKPIVTQRVRGFMPQSEQASSPGTLSQDIGTNPGSGMSIPQAVRSPGLQGRALAAQPLDFIPPNRPTGSLHGSNGPPSNKPAGNLLPYELNRSYSATNRPPPPIAGFVSDQRTPPILPIEQSSTDSPQRRSSVGGLQPSQSAATVVGTSNTTAQGEFDSETAPVLTGQGSSDSVDHITFGSNQRSPSLLNVQFTPTQPNPAPPVPFGRSKSQLKLVLEREKEKGHDVRPTRPSTGPKGKDSSGK